MLTRTLTLVLEQAPMGHPGGGGGVSAEGTLRQKYRIR